MQSLIGMKKKLPWFSFKIGVISEGIVPAATSPNIPE
jgi:hypothetical protein